ncbi:MAG: ADP-ribosylglycohydrolase family protein [Kiritimatiellaeota bacterium]|nr:ADP-ribosylglycohydrolase family protein [Kiritimatiellota bacterium]
MIGAVAGDIIGSVYEFNPIKTTDFPLFQDSSRFTDDTVLTVALASSILFGLDYRNELEKFYYKYPHAGYGGNFHKWASGHDHSPYNSWGNGSAMRVSPVGFAYDSIEDVLRFSRESAEITHNHPEGIKGAQATALAVFLARTEQDKASIKKEISKRFDYDLERTLDEIRPGYSFDVSCQGTVPEAIIAFLESDDYEDAVRKAVSLGGDSDTLACIIGGIAQAFYGNIPSMIIDETKNFLTEDLWDITEQFNKKFNCRF